MTRYAPVPGERATLTPIGGGVEVSNPSRRTLFVVAFLLVWLCGWLMGEVTAIHALLSPANPSPPSHGAPTAFLAGWLLAWTVGGFFALLTVAWTLAGRERLRIGSDELRLRRDVMGIGVATHYDPKRVRNLRAVEIVPAPFGLGSRSPFGWGSRPLASDDGACTVRFGAGLDSAEANPLARKIIAAVPRLRPPSDSDS